MGALKECGAGANPSPVRGRLMALSEAALGVTSGDSGTGPFYAVREAFSESCSLKLIEASVLGALSLIF